MEGAAPHRDERRTMPDAFHVPDADVKFVMDTEIRRCLDLIKLTMRRAGFPDPTDEQAAGWAIQGHAKAIENDMVVLSRRELAHTIASYSAHALSVFSGDRVEVGDDGTRRFTFEHYPGDDGDPPVSTFDAPSVPVH